MSSKIWMILIGLLTGVLLTTLVFSLSGFENAPEKHRDKIRMNLVYEIGKEMNQDDSCGSLSREELDIIQKRVDPEYLINLIEIEIDSNECLVRTNVENGGAVVYSPTTGLYT